MKIDVFRSKSPEFQKEFLDRGGTVEGINAPSDFIDHDFKWSNRFKYGREGKKAYLKRKRTEMKQKLNSRRRKKSKIKTVEAEPVEKKTILLKDSKNVEGAANATE
jgi:hypothetical protein